MISNAQRPDPPRRELDERDVDPDPFVQLRRWLEAAFAAQQPEPSAMTLATATRAGKPSARMVILRGLDERGFVFYTDYDSRKGEELAANPFASLVFHWPALSRQVRVEGRVSEVSARESDAYFESRPAGSRLAAWAAPQSQVIDGREMLEQRVRELEQQYGEQAAPRPPRWGGYRVARDLRVLVGPRQPSARPLALYAATGCRVAHRAADAMTWGWVPSVARRAWWAVLSGDSEWGQGIKAANKEPHAKTQRKSPWIRFVRGCKESKNGVPRRTGRPCKDSLPRLRN